MTTFLRMKRLHLTSEEMALMPADYASRLITALVIINELLTLRKLTLLANPKRKSDDLEFRAGGMMACFLYRQLIGKLSEVYKFYFYKENLQAAFNDFQSVDADIQSAFGRLKELAEKYRWLGDKRNTLIFHYDTNEVAERWTSELGTLRELDIFLSESEWAAFSDSAEALYLILLTTARGSPLPKTKEQAVEILTELHSVIGELTDISISITSKFAAAMIGAFFPGKLEEVDSRPPDMMQRCSFVEETLIPFFVVPRGGSSPL